MNKPWRFRDPDFPDPSDMTPEQRAVYLEAFDAATPKLSSSDKGVVVIVGTMSDMDRGSEGLEAIFYGRPDTPAKMQEEVGKLVRYFTPHIWVWEENSENQQHGT